MDISKLRKKAAGAKKPTPESAEAEVTVQNANPPADAVAAADALPTQEADADAFGRAESSGAETVVVSDLEPEADEDAFGEPEPNAGVNPAPVQPGMGGLLGQLAGDQPPENAATSPAPADDAEWEESDEENDWDAFDEDQAFDDDEEDLYEGYDADLERLGLLAQIGQSAVGSDLVEYLFFQANNEPYALRIGRVKEIIKPRALTVVPRSPEYMQGILALRGEMIPVLDLGACLGLRDNAVGLDEGEQPRIVVLAKGENKLGLVVDRILGVIRMDENLFEDPAAVQGARDNRYVQAIGKNTDGFVIVLDVDEFFVQGET